MPDDIDHAGFTPIDFQNRLQIRIPEMTNQKILGKRS